MGSAISGFVDKVSTLVEHAASGKLDMNDLMTVASLAAMCCTGGASAALTGAMEGALTSALGSVVESAIGSAIESAVGEGLISEAMGEALKEVVHQAVQEAIQQGEQKLDEGLKGIQDETGHGIDKGEFKKCVEDEYRQDIDQLGKMVRDSIEEEGQKSGKGKGKGKGESSGGGSWFDILAKALGQMLDKQAAKVAEASDKVQGMIDKEAEQGKDVDKATADQTASAMTALQSETQKMNFMMNGATNVLQTIGGACATMAKRG